MHFLYINKRYRRSEPCACLGAGRELGPGASKSSSLAALTSHQAGTRVPCPSPSLIPWEKELGGLISRDLHLLIALSEQRAQTLLDPEAPCFTQCFAAELQSVTQLRQPP